MSFRARLLLACVPLALVPLVLFGLDTRREVIERLDSQYAERVAALAGVIQEDLTRESEAVAARLDRVAEQMDADANLRLALLGGPDGDPAARGSLLDYAGRVMPLTGLEALRIQADDGRVLSSGHFRAEYDSFDPALLAALDRAGEEALLVELPTPSGPMLALARRRTVAIGPEAFAVVGGAAVDEPFLDRLSRGTGLDVRLVLPGADDEGGVGEDFPAHLRQVPVRFAGPTAAADGTARFEVRASDAPLALLRSDLNRRLLWTSIAVATLALLLAVFVSGQISRPLAALARRADRIDLDRLDTRFPTRRRDEIGRLAKVLDRMTRRLRSGTARLREAERRAATGDLARQVHHDVRNGLIPIRNVLGHLTELARESPERLPEVFLERHHTLESSVDHLHTLAANYARLSPSLERRPCDVNRIVRDAIGDASSFEVAGGGSRVRVETELADGLPPVPGDPAALRRIVANLVGNSLESLEDEKAGAGEHATSEHVIGRVLVRTRVLRSGEAPRIELVVEDTGRGMAPDERARAFDDFFSTKPRGTGLGLSIVRRLVSDLGGRIAVESSPGEGTRFTIELPVGAGRASSGAQPERGEKGPERPRQSEAAGDASGRAREHRS